MAGKQALRFRSMPKLGRKDKMLYGAICILLLGLFLLSSLGILALQNKIAFSDERVIGASGGSGSANYILMLLWVGLVFILLLAVLIQFRIPLFGRSDVSYGPPRYPAIYPLFMKNKPRSRIDPKTQKRRKLCLSVITTVFLGTFLISLSLLPTSVYGRNVLSFDGTITVYDEGNRQTTHYEADDIIEVKIKTASRIRSRSWHVAIVFITSDGKNFTFGFNGSKLQQLQTMLEMKERFDEIITIERADQPSLDRVILDQNLNAAEAELLYQLFEVEPET